MSIPAFMKNWFHLEHLTALTITGPDAVNFAQAQFSVDLDRPVDAGWRPLAWCDPKGRVICVMLAHRGHDHVQLILPTTMADKVSQKLPVFAIGRKVEFENGSYVGGCLQDVEASDSLTFDPRRGIRLTIEAPDPSRESRTAWKMADICCGMPWITPDSSGRFLPQELGLEALNAVSYQKGCFPGQEVIARVHYLGKAKRRLDGLALPQTTLPPPGTTLADSENDRIGEIIDAAGDGERVIGLAVLKTNVATGSTVRIMIDRQRFEARVTPCERLC